MQMNASSIVNQKAEWEKLGVKLPAFDHAAMTAATKEHPIWVHFGAGNIFRGFIAALQQRLLNEGVARPPICCGKSLPKAGFEPEAGKNDGPLPEERPVSVNTLMVVGIYFLRWMLSETVSTVQGPPYVTLAAVEALIFRRPEHQTSALA